VNPPRSADLLIIIVNYRTAELTIDGLRALAPEVAAVPEARAAVVDNASGDGSAERLAAAVRDQGWEDWATIQPLSRNEGFAAGNNQAIRAALAGPTPPRYVLLLNPDTLVRPGALRTLIAFMEARPDIGIAGARLEEPDGTPQHSAFRFHSVLSELEKGLRLGVASRLLRRWRTSLPIPCEACRVDWVSGACMIVRREVFETVGLLDEGYFLYYEENDFCRRAANAGWPCWYVPEARVVHLVGQSSGINRPRTPPERRPAYWFHSRRRYMRTHLGPFGAVLADLLWASGYALFRLRRAIQRRPTGDPPWLFWDFLRYSSLTPWRPRSAAEKTP
jgi:N-acetylglucosaminyl-diphospho-decaprenol L-rhamnosyltransferase